MILSDGPRREHDPLCEGYVFDAEWEQRRADFVYEVTDLHVRRQDAMAMLAALDELARVRARLEAQEKALKFYGDPKTYEASAEPHPTRFASGVIPIDLDEGERARAALEASREKHSRLEERALGRFA